jgi:hypothetical protein
MMIQRFLKLGYAIMTVKGFASIVAPKQMAKLDARLMLCGFENTDQLEVKDWYADTSRIAGIGLFVTGLVGLLASRSEESLVEAKPSADDDDDVVEIDV